MEITLGGVYNESISRWVPNSPIPQDTGLICLYLAQPYRDSFNVLVYLFHDTAYLASLSVMICSIIACRTDNRRDCTKPHSWQTWYVPSSQVLSLSVRNKSIIPSQRDPSTARVWYTWMDARHAFVGCFPGISPRIMFYTFWWVIWNQTLMKQI